ncbi:MAG: thiamine phosphate synthase [Pyramidobacter sp.]|jgi:thiamine-phosphate diphosphorylase/hydroxyethylthiazole kinase
MLFSSQPLIHVITNEAAVAQTANALLAAGARAICADSPREAEQICALADGLNINVGMPSERKVQAMVLAGKAANRRGIPVVLDPVGAGASDFRREILDRLLHEVRFTAIRGNQSEIAALCRLSFRSAGVEDAGVAASTEQLLALSKECGAIVAATGKRDRVAFGGRVEELSGGSPLLKSVTGSGCMLSALLAAALADGRKRRASSAVVSSSACEADGDVLVKTLKFYKNAAAEAELDMKAGGAFGTARFAACLMDRIGRAGRPQWSAACLRLYAVTDRRWLGGGDLCATVEQALRGGATMVQLREKALDFSDFEAEARRLLPLCHRYQAPLIINDNVDLCAAVGADGVHLGQDDASVAEARRRLGADAIIGATAHTIAEAMEAQRAGADYLGVGAAFGSSTKVDASTIELDQYRRITQAVDVPVVAIGGIDAENVHRLAGLGVAGVAVISALFAAKEVQRAARQLFRAAASL